MSAVLKAMANLKAFIADSRHRRPGTVRSAPIEGLGLPLFSRIDSCGRVRLSYDNKPVSRMRVEQLIRKALPASPQAEKEGE